MEKIESISRIIMFTSFYTIAICFFIYLWIVNRKINKEMDEYWKNELKNQKEIQQRRIELLEKSYELWKEEAELNKASEEKPKKGRKKNV